MRRRHASVRRGPLVGRRSDQFAQGHRHSDAGDVATAISRFRENARALEGNGDNAAAEREARAAVRIAPNYEGAHVALAGALESLGRSSDALAEYRRAHELADWDSEVNAKLAALGHP